MPTFSNSSAQGSKSEAWASASASRCNKSFVSISFCASSFVASRTWSSHLPARAASFASELRTNPVGAAMRMISHDFAVASWHWHFSILHALSLETAFCNRRTRKGLLSLLSEVQLLAVPGLCRWMHLRLQVLHHQSLANLAIDAKLRAEPTMRPGRSRSWIRTFGDASSKGALSHAGMEARLLSSLW